MAIPIPKLNVLTHPSHPTLKKTLPTALPSIHRQPLLSRISKTRLQAVAKDDSLSSIITQLGRNQLQEELEEEEANQPTLRIADHWREIHGRDDWAGLLDPIDPLLRSELIRYGEFAQACYDAFDFDPFSRNCGSCKYNRRKFFQSLGMADAGYDVTRYLYATSNFNLPNFFSRSRWSRMWSQRANWIGYVAVSEEEEAARLGRRDIVVAWRGTVTKLEWVADLMDYLRPVASEGIPCPDPAVKVESGFVDLYTDKDPSCRFCRYSAREQVIFSAP